MGLEFTRTVYLGAIVLLSISAALIVLMKNAAEPPNPKEAVKWLYCASYDGHTRAQYQLALCLHQGRGVNRNIQEAVCHHILTKCSSNLISSY